MVPYQSKLRNIFAVNSPTKSFRIVRCTTYRASLRAHHSWSCNPVRVFAGTRASNNAITPCQWLSPVCGPTARADARWDETARSCSVKYPEVSFS